MSCQIPRNKPFSSAGSCSSADIIGGNDDLLTEILILLPAKTLVTFKSVSKQWQSLISSEYFARRHVQIHGRRLRRAETRHSFRRPFMICRPTIETSFPINLPDHAERVTILQSMNGLLLLSLKLGEIHCAVFNPTTQAYRVIDLDGYATGLVKIWLFYDPSKSEHYKLVMKTSALIRPFSVYDSATHRWSHGWNSRSVLNSVFGCNFGSSRAEKTLFQFHVCGLLLIYRVCDDDEEKEDLEVMVDYRNDDGFYVQNELPFEYVHTFFHTFASV